MIDVCPKCGRRVANDETLVRAKGAWYPTACGHRLGALDGVERVTNHLRFYTSARNDEGQCVFLTGPFPDFDAARSDLGRAIRLAHQSGDLRAPWYGYGVSSTNRVAAKVKFGA